MYNYKYREYSTEEINDALVKEIVDVMLFRNEFDVDKTVSQFEEFVDDYYKSGNRGFLMEQIFHDKLFEYVPSDSMAMLRYVLERYHYYNDRDLRYVDFDKKTPLSKFHQETYDEHMENLSKNPHLRNRYFHH